MNFNNAVKVFIAALAMAFATQVHAQVPAPKLLVGKQVYLVSADSTRFGGCKAKISYPFSGDADLAAYCGSNEISFGCDGTLGNTKTDAQNMYNNALAALVTGRTVNVRVDAAYIVDGICSATRVDLN